MRHFPIVETGIDADGVATFQFDAEMGTAASQASSKAKKAMALCFTNVRGNGCCFVTFVAVHTKTIMFSDISHLLFDFRVPTYVDNTRTHINKIFSALLICV